MTEKSTDQRSLDLIADIANIIDNTKKEMGIFEDDMGDSIIDINKSVDINDLSIIKDKLLSSTESIKAKTKAMGETLNKKQEQFKAMEERLNDVGVELEEAQKKTLTDGLTGLYNRFAFDRAIELETRKSTNNKNPLSIIMFDLDHFKQVNDKFGHQAGDEVLRIVSKRASEFTRKTDFLARYGGEEFILILPQTRLHDAKVIAEKIRSNVASKPVKHEEINIFARTSLGVCQHRHGEHSKELVERADKALYKAKNNGRNCVCSS
jgi:diguanylate cyclase